MDKKLDKLVQKVKNTFKWLAVDEDGDVRLYEKKPRIHKSFNWWECPDGYGHCVADTNDKELKNNWKKTLRRIR